MSCGKEEPACSCEPIDNISCTIESVTLKRVVITNYPECGDSIDIQCRSTENLVHILYKLGLVLET